jgi:hypothetical protein
LQRSVLFIAAFPLLLLALISQDPVLLPMIVGLYLVVDMVAATFVAWESPGPQSLAILHANEAEQTADNASPNADS